MQRDHSTAWLLNRKCMTISSQNYRTCFILAAFYRSLGLTDATKLGRVLHHVFRHHIIFCLRCNGMQDYKVHSGESDSASNFRDSSIVILFFVGIIFLVAIYMYLAALLYNYTPSVKVSEQLYMCCCCMSSVYHSATLKITIH